MIQKTTRFHVEHGEKQMKLNKKELEYLIDHAEHYVRRGRFFVNDIENIVTKNKDGSVRKNSSHTYESADSWAESLEFYEPLLEKLKSFAKDWRTT